jgi:hypothetical protein
MMSDPKREVEFAGMKHPLPSNVIEQSPDRTTVYTAGKLVYDGATGGGNAMATRAAVSGLGSGGAPGASLNEMLQWGIANSSPSELERRAAAGARPLQKIDQEIMDMLLGQPVVASMRSAMGKLEPSELDKEEGIDAALAALEVRSHHAAAPAPGGSPCRSLPPLADCTPRCPLSLPPEILPRRHARTDRPVTFPCRWQELLYYCEDVDHAIDFAKIGGIQAVLQCMGAPAPPPETDKASTGEADAKGGGNSRLPTLSPYQPEVAAAACGVLAAAAQNNPPFQRACLALRVHRVLLALLSPDAPPAATAVRQKACLAVSALLRASAEAAAAVLALPQAPACLASLAADPDTKVRRRTLFLLLCLLREFSLSADAVRPMLPPAVLLASASDEDPDVRESALQLTLALSGDGEFRCAAARGAAPENKTKIKQSGKGEAGHPPRAVGCAREVGAAQGMRGGTDVGGGMEGQCRWVAARNRGLTRSFHRDLALPSGRGGGGGSFRRAGDGPPSADP